MFKQVKEINFTEKFGAQEKRSNEQYVEDIYRCYSKFKLSD